MEVRSNLKVFNEADIAGKAGAAAAGISTKKLVGCNERPSERIVVTLATFKPGTCSPCHWHLTEKLYFVVSGRGVIKDIQGKSYDIGPGSVVYAPPGIEGSHEFDAHEQLQLIAVSGTTEPEKTLQFSVDRATMESTIDLNMLANRLGGAKFKSLY